MYEPSTASAQPCAATYPPLSPPPAPFPDDRRRGPRVPQKRPVKVFEPTSGRFFAGVTYDISGSGLRIGLPLSAPVFEGRTVTVHVGREGRHGPLASRRFMIPARVVWLHRDPGTSRETRCGLEFVQDADAVADTAAAA